MHGYRFGDVQVCTDGPLTDEEQQALAEYFALVDAARADADDPSDTGSRDGGP